MGQHVQVDNTNSTKMDRRSLLRCAIASTIPATLVAANAHATPVTTELPVDRVSRLGWGLAEALNDYCNGSMHAVIHPTNSKGEWSVGFIASHLELRPEKQAEVAAMNLKAAMEKLAPGNYDFKITPEAGTAVVVRRDA
ncbi:hypothetical protein [Phyllobacterium sp. 22552]|uniref:hypothetical protein n=1 Tax=Phyllobacterium sp. 22552 TaxID=3453941 RepID=UPI003F8284C2